MLRLFGGVNGNNIHRSYVGLQYCENPALHLFSDPKDCVNEIVLVDDGSTDSTIRVAQSLALQLIVHPHNAGYGAKDNSLPTQLE
jgi:hypothetical protein